MSATWRSRTGSLAAMWLLSVAVGCATTESRPASLPPNTLGDQRQQRRDELQQQFESDRDTALLSAALVDADNGDTKKASETLERLLTHSPEHRRARLMLADIHLLEGDYAQATAHVEHLLRRDPNDVDALRGMAELCDAQGHSEEAARLYERAHELSRDSSVVTASYDAAADASSDASRGSPSVIGALSHVSASAAVREAELDVAEGRIESATTKYRRAIVAQRSNPQIAISASVTLLRHAQPDAAAEVAAFALQYFPACASLHRVLGVAHYRRGDYVSSEVALRQALSLDSENPLTYFLMDRTAERIRHGQTAALPRLAP